MARRCEVCGKGTVSGNNVSHAKNATRRVWRPNLMKVRTLVGKTMTTVKVCARCLKSDKIIKA